MHTKYASISFLCSCDSSCGQQLISSDRKPFSQEVFVQGPLKQLCHKSCSHNKISIEVCYK